MSEARINGTSRSFTVPAASLAWHFAEHGSIAVAMWKSDDVDGIREALLALEGVVRAMEGRPARKVIVVPHRIVNIVV